MSTSHPGSRSRSQRIIIRSLLVIFMSVQTLLVPAAHAAMIGTDQILAEENRADHQARIASVLERQDAADALSRFGVDQDRLQERMDRLSDAELAQLAQQAEDLPAGEGALGVLVFLLVLLILLDLLGVTNVFPAIQSGG